IVNDAVLYNRSNWRPVNCAPCEAKVTLEEPELPAAMVVEPAVSVCDLAGVPDRRKPAANSQPAARMNPEAPHSGRKLNNPDRLDKSFSPPAGSKPALCIDSNKSPRSPPTPIRE